MVLVFPFFAFSQYYIALASTVLSAILVILVFTYFVSVAKDVPFRKRFLEMVAISLGVAAISFAIGFAVKLVLNVEV
jgi:VIT1/CCC1 family predicted Fe2+/Mn2+ transporter